MSYLRSLFRHSVRHKSDSTNMANKKEVEEQTTLDKLNSNLGSASEKIANNKKLIYWIVGGIAAVAAIIFGYIFLIRNPKINKGYDEWTKIQVEQLQGKINDSVAAAQYKKVADNYDGYAPGNVSALEAGEILYQEGKYDEAIKYLEKANMGEKVLDANILVLIGDCYVNTNKNDKALEYYTDAIKKAKNNPMIVPRVLLKEANVYEAQKKHDKVMECYKQIQAEYPNFQLGNGASIDAYIGREEGHLGK